MSVHGQLLEESALSSEHAVDAARRASGEPLELRHTRYRGGMERWHIPSVEASGRREPKVLFSTPECRAVVIDLSDGDELGDHSVHERAVVEVVAGEVQVAAGGDEMTCAAGTLLMFAPGERHAVRAAGGAARLLLMLAPWPGEGHYRDGADADAARMPSRGSAEPMR
jgi:quercetin dioxygenase-like cupin family protein